MPEDYMAMYKQALQRLSTGGMSLEASLQEIEEGKKQAIAGGQQALVSGGLGGTTVMGGVPLQAEKIASRQRLGARGRAEEKYLTTLASFAAFAQRGEEARLEREAAMERLQTSIAGPGGTGATVGGTQRWGTYGAGTPSGAGAVGAGAGGYAAQFPSLYDGGAGAAPDLMGDGIGAGGGIGAGRWAGLFEPGAGEDVPGGDMYGPGMYDETPEGLEPAPAGFRYTETGINPYTRKPRYTLTAISGFRAG